MKANENIEKVYELVEQFDFEELSEHDQFMVLAVISEVEYCAMRFSIKETQLYFAQDDLPILKATSFVREPRPNVLLRFLKQPIPLYKVAASILVMVGLFAGYEMIKPKQNKFFASAQNITTAMKRDTVFVNILDTLEIIKERIVYVERIECAQMAQVKPSESKSVLDCDKEMCPKEIEMLKNLACNNKIGNDTVLRQCLKYLN